MSEAHDGHNSTLFNTDCLLYFFLCLRARSGVHKGHQTDDVFLKGRFYKGDVLINSRTTRSNVLGEN